MNKVKVKKILISFLIVFLFSVVMMSFIVIKKLKTPDKSSSDYKSLVFNYNLTNNVKILNSVAITDEFGKNIEEDDSSTSYDFKNFSVRNDSEDIITYSICLTKKDSGFDKIKSNYIKVYLTNKNGEDLNDYFKNKIPTFSDLSVLKNKPSSVNLYSDSINVGETKYYTLRTWLSDSYIVDTNVEDFSFDIDICGR